MLHCKSPDGRGRTRSKRHSWSGVRSRPPSLDTVWESHDVVEAVPKQEDIMAAGSADLMAGSLRIRPGGWGPFKMLFRRSWQERHGVLQPAGAAGGPPQLLLFQSEGMEQLHEVVTLQSPLELHCLPADGNLFRFVLCAAGDSVELAATSEEQRTLWMLALGDSVCCPSSPPSSQPSSPAAKSPQGDWVSAGAVGRVRLRRMKLADNYTMGRVLEQRENLIVVEGFHRKTYRSHALKIVSKSAVHVKQLKQGGGALAAGGACGPELISQCIEEVYEGPNHACLVMKWGTHELDTEHRLAAAVLEALRLLHELLPDQSAVGADSANQIMLQGDDTERLVRRVLTLDRLLQANLFI